MKFEIRMYREDVQQWAYAEVEINDADMAAAPMPDVKFIGRELAPYIHAMLELPPE